MRFVFDNSTGATPYYDKLPEGFLVPAIYFPAPEIETRGDTFSTYAIEYSWYIKVFHVNQRSAHELALSILTAIRAARNLIPLIDEAGAAIGKGFRLDDPELKNLNETPNAVQIALYWKSPRYYNDAQAQKMMVYGLDMYSKNAYREAIAHIGTAHTKKQTGGITMSNKPDMEAAESGAAKTPTIPKPPKFSVKRLRKDCLKLFGVTVSTFDGATRGLCGEFSVEEMAERIKKWLSKPIPPSKNQKKEVK